MKKMSIVSRVITGVLLFFTIAPGITQNPVTIRKICGGSDLPKGCIGRSYTIQFTAEGGTVTNWRIGNPISFQNAGNFTLAPTTGVLSGTISPTALINTPYQLDVIADDMVTGQSIAETFYLRVESCASTDPNVCPCVQEVAFVLDQSGSMNYPSGNTKWSEMLNVLGNYFPVLQNQMNHSIDTWCVILFEGNNAIRIQEGSFLTAPDINAIRSSYAPGGATPMGGGIQRALMNFYSPPSELWKQPSVILLTDGMQNMNPMVSVNGQDLVIDPSRFPANGILGQMPSDPFPVHLPDYRLKAFAVGFGNLPSQVQSVLDNLSNRNFENAASSNLNNFFNSTIPNVLKGCTPRIVDVRRDTTPIFDVFKTEQFDINDGAESFTLQLAASDSHRFTSAVTSLWRDGQQIMVQPVSASRSMVLYHVRFPLIFPDGTVIPTSKGKWAIRVADAQNQVPYELTAFLDDENIHSELHFKGTESFVAGDPLPVQVSLWASDTTLGDANVVAYLLRPGDDLGDVIARASASQDSLKNMTGDQSLGQAKITYLTAQTAYEKILEPKPLNAIPLQHTGGGMYEGVFTGNAVTGSYRVIVQFHGSHPSAGAYQGWIANSAFFDFARPDDITLNPQLYVVPLNKIDNYTHILQFTPTNRFKRRIGPAQEQRIRVQLSQGTVDTLVDRLDGTYEAFLKVPAGVNPDIKVFVIDQQTPVLTTTLNNLQCAGVKRFGLLANGGLTQPTGDLDTLYDAGGFLELGASYRFNCSWAAEVVAGYYGFKSGFSILGASVFGVYSRNNLFGSGNYIGRLAAGAGVFVPKNEDATAGFAVKLGLHKPVNSRSEVGVDFAYYHLPKPGYSFLGIGLGYRYYF